MLKIRLMRIGTKKRPFYRVVVVDERSKRTGGYIENLGTYNPLTEPKEIKLNQDRINYWTKQGAQASVGFLRIIGKAPQRQPRKPKKEVKQAPVQEAPKAEPTAAEPEKSEGQKISEPVAAGVKSDVHEPDQAVAVQSETGELEKQVQPSNQSVPTEKQ